MWTEAKVNFNGVKKPRSRAGKKQKTIKSVSQLSGTPKQSWGTHGNLRKGSIIKVVFGAGSWFLVLKILALS